MSKLLEYVDARRDATLAELIELLKVPSVSTDPARRADVKRCAEQVADRLREAGLDTEIFATDGHPIVFGERLKAPGKPTVLVYGHYDVQPPDPVDLWRHGPFSPTVEGEYIVARGACDDKGQFYALVKGLQAALAVGGELPVNVKVLIEGEEEIGSPHLGPFIRREKKRLACDIVVISDTAQFGIDMPAITYGLRGLVYLELIVRGPARDLHSGTYGGTVANPANVLARLVAACWDEDGRVAIPGFYDDVRPLEASERRQLRALPYDEKAFVDDLGVPRTFGEPTYTTRERAGCRPTFDVNGLVSGFTGEGAKTVLPSAARAKFSMRLVPDQDPATIAELTKEYLAEIAPDTVTIEIETHHGANAILVPRDGPAIQAAVRAIHRAFGRDPVFVREGGSIPVVETFKNELGVDSLLIGLAQSNDNAHSPNERFRLVDYYRGMVTMAALLDELARR
jgi:acetylornithine deacetylase/succinyl-diaminopimelate desuccinylase-like protein